MGTTDDSALCGVDRALDRLRVAMKRDVGRLVVETVPGCPDLPQLLVVHAVEQGPPTERDDVTVGLIAGRLGVDPSHASRLVTAAIRSGLVRRVASQEDGRRSRLELTELGRKIADGSRQVRLELVARAMAGWDAAEQAEFARLLERFTDGLWAASGLAGAGCPGHRAHGTPAHGTPAHGHRAHGAPAHGHRAHGTSVSGVPTSGNLTPPSSLTPSSLTPGNPAAGNSTTQADPDT